MMCDHVLVDMIYEMVGCDYLCEIKYPQWRQKVMEVMLNLLSDSGYTPEQWSYAASYVFEEPATFSTNEEVRHYLESKL